MIRPAPIAAAAAAVALAAAGYGVLLAASGVPAAAQALPTPTATPTPPQVLPPVPAPQPPAQAAPVFEFLAPTVYPSCGTAALLIFLPGAELGPVGGYVATQLYDVGGPIFAICGAVPRPPATYECLLDTQQQAILNTLEANAAGTTVPLGLRPVGSLVEQTIVVQDKLPPLQQQLPAPANSLNAGNLAVQFLVCSPVIDTPPETNDFFPPIAQPSSEPFVSQPSAFVPGTAGTPARTLGGTAGIPTSVLPRTIRPSSPVGDGVRYAAVWLLPLALLAMFGYLGGAFNREVTPPPA